MRLFSNCKAVQGSLKLYWSIVLFDLFHSICAFSRYETSNVKVMQTPPRRRIRKHLCSKRAYLCFKGDIWLTGIHHDNLCYGTFGTNLERKLRKKHTFIAKKLNLTCWVFGVLSLKSLNDKINLFPSIKSS